MNNELFFETQAAFKIINPTLILSLSLALAAVCLSCIPLGRFYQIYFDNLIICENQCGSPISGYYAYWFWYQELPRELLQVDCNQLFWVFGELINQERLCKLMDRFSNAFVNRSINYSSLSVNYGPYKIFTYSNYPIEDSCIRLVHSLLLW